MLISTRLDMIEMTDDVSELTIEMLSWRLYCFSELAL